MPSSSVLILPFHPQLSLLFPFTAGGIKADINPGFPYFPLWQAAQAPASPAKYLTFRNNTTHWILQWSMLQFVELYSSAEILDYCDSCPGKMVAPTAFFPWALRAGLNPPSWLKLCRNFLSKNWTAFLIAVSDWPVIISGHLQSLQLCCVCKC